MPFCGVRRIWGWMLSPAPGREVAFDLQRAGQPLDGDLGRLRLRDERGPAGGRYASSLRLAVRDGHADRALPHALGVPQGEPVVGVDDVIAHEDLRPAVVAREREPLGRVVDPEAVPVRRGGEAEAGQLEAVLVHGHELRLVAPARQDEAAGQLDALDGRVVVEEAHPAERAVAAPADEVGGAAVGEAHALGPCPQVDADAQPAVGHPLHHGGVPQGLGLRQVVGAGHVGVLDGEEHVLGEFVDRHALGVEPLEPPDRGDLGALDGLRAGVVDRPIGVHKREAAGAAC